MDVVAEMGRPWAELAAEFGEAWLFAWYRIRMSPAKKGSKGPPEPGRKRRR